ncbi:MAG: FeoA family protein [Roseivirga sp.]
MRTLSDLKINQKGTISGFTDETLAVKLMEMGCLPGTEVSVALIAPLGDPMAISVSGYQLSLRKEEALSITIEG